MPLRGATYIGLWAMMQPDQHHNHGKLYLSLSRVTK